MEKRSTPKDVVRPAVPSTTERSLRELSSPQRAFFLRCRPKLPVKAGKTPRFLKKTPRYLEHIPKVRTFASQLRTRALSSAGSERLPYKQRVGGSNPSAPTFFQTAIHRKMDCCFFVHEGNGGRVGGTRKLGVRLCAKPASAGCAVVCFAWNVGRMQFLLRACLRCCRRCLGGTSSRNRSMGGVVL